MGGELLSTYVVELADRLRRRSLQKNEEKLWGDYVFQVGFDLNGGETGGVPATAEGFHE